MKEQTRLFILYKRKKSKHSSKKLYPLANELGLIYKFSIEIIFYVMTWYDIATKHHNSYRKRKSIPKKVVYIQLIVLKKTAETIFFDRRTGLNRDSRENDSSSNQAINE
ncbi:hypothetical protein CWI38_0285p0010 [Hamiltosporidium tvaerminnensis]|uniref:Uncharacterized protein n=1 Tax=Hamiltosporidium tvaerminnensis TaxID=1176355 RepID=A0A4Q9M178_9MICR|nr:hypothetical protein CWI38_0285p0010 [Hamiltosporidium tvaerminnensis]